jgi:curved DNA-binding protein CbpA
MSDCFALLDEPRRPWLEPEELKQKFLALSAEFHPDRLPAATEEQKRAAQDRYAGINAAYQKLKEPKERLAHLLELELGVKLPDIQKIPADLMNLFFKVSNLCREADAFLNEKASVSSPLLQIGIFERGQEWTGRLSELQQQILAQREQLLVELRELDERWEPARKPESPEREPMLRRLEEIYRLLGYYGRWTGQIHERIARISF